MQKHHFSFMCIRYAILNLYVIEKFRQKILNVSEALNFEFTRARILFYRPSLA